MCETYIYSSNFGSKSQAETTLSSEIPLKSKKRSKKPSLTFELAKVDCQVDQQDRFNTNKKLHESCDSITSIQDQLPF